MARIFLRNLHAGEFVRLSMVLESINAKGENALIRNSSIAREKHTTDAITHASFIASEGKIS